MVFLEPSSADLPASLPMKGKTCIAFFTSTFYQPPEGGPYRRRFITLMQFCSIRKPGSVNVEQKGQNVRSKH